MTTNFRKIAKLLRIDLIDFRAFMDEALNARNANPHKILFDSYDKSLQAAELCDARLAVWIQPNIDKPDFEAGYKIRQERLKRLEQISLEKLERIFRAYQRNRASRQ